MFLIILGIREMIDHQSNSFRAPLQINKKWIDGWAQLNYTSM